MVDLDSDPTKLIEIVEIGKQLLITRGALTTFSIANDIAKYFAIIPAMFAAVYPGLDALNIMRLHSPTSAILSAVIFNAIIIVALIPLALRGVRYKPGERGGDAAPQPARSTASAASSPRSSASSSSTSSSSSSQGSRDASTQPGSPSTSPRCGRCSSSPSLLGLAYPLAMVAVAQIPGLSDHADGSLVSQDGNARRQRASSDSRSPTTTATRCRSTSSPGRPRPATATTRPRPAASNLGPESVVDTLPDPAVKDDAGNAEPAHPGLRPQQGRRRARGRRRRRPYCTADGVGAVLAVFHRDGCTGPVTRVVSLNQACPATPFLATYQGVTGGVREVRRGLLARASSPRSGATRRPTRPCRPTRSPPAAAGSTRTSAPPTPQLQAPRVAKARGIDVGQRHRS